MIINRYIQRNIHLGTFAALLILVSLSLFFLFVNQLDKLGQGDYGLLQALSFVALSTPGKVVEFMPLAVLLGSILSLGSLAGNSEIIAMQASGVSVNRMLGSVLQAAVLLALLSFLLADWVVPDSETSARQLRSQAQQQTTAMNSREGLWIKDDLRVVHIGSLLPNGFARDVEIYQLDRSGGLVSTLRAEHAIPLKGGWELQQVQQSIIRSSGSQTRHYERLRYDGNLSNELLQALTVEPRYMSSSALFGYLDFLEQNKLDARVERLIFWQKLFAPLTVVIMCMLALPFVLGSQRQSGSGQRLLIGILLGLAFVVVDRLLIQLGTQFAISAVLIAILPSLLFLSLAIFLLLKKQSHRIGVGFFSRPRQR